MVKLEDYSKYYIQGSEHYLIPKNIFDELFNEMSNWKEESQKQKEVIDKAIEYCDNNKEFAPRLEDVLDILKEVE